MEQFFAADLVRSAGIILFDGHCAFCRNVVGLILRQCGESGLRVCSTRSARGAAAVRSRGLEPAETFAFVTTERTEIGVAAYIRLLGFCPRLRWMAWFVAAVPKPVAGRVYRAIADHRKLASKLFGRGSETAIPHEVYVEDGEG